jgi:hypothetical protein
MNGGNSGNNGFDLNKNNILKPTFDNLTEEGRKAFVAYHTDLKELFLSSDAAEDCSSGYYTNRLQQT